MNRTSHEIAIPLDVPREVAEPGLMSDFMVLTKARLSLLVIVTTFVGFCAASDARLGLAASGPRRLRDNAGRRRRSGLESISRGESRSPHGADPLSPVARGPGHAGSSPRARCRHRRACSASPGWRSLPIPSVPHSRRRPFSSTSPFTPRSSGTLHALYHRRSDIRGYPADDRRVGGGEDRRSISAPGSCSAFSLPGKCRISSPSPGCIATNMPKPGSSCCSATM